MKPILALSLTLAAMLCFVSCSENDLYKENEPKVYTPADFKMTESYDVVVEEGTSKQVLVNGEVVYDGEMSLTIEIPKVGLATRASGIQEIVTQSNGNNKTKLYKKGVLFFEDVTNGDNDYNDLVCYIDEVIELKKNDDKPKYDVTVTPLAMGNQKKIQLGVDIVVNGDVWKSILLKENKDLKELFYGKGVKGYINTEKNKPYYKGEPFEDKDYQANGTIKEKAKVVTNYYIIVDGDGKKRYACDSKDAELTINDVPFGMYIPGVKTFKYAQEFKSFFEAYPNFMLWVGGAKVDPFSDPDTSLLY